MFEYPFVNGVLIIIAFPVYGQFKCPSIFNHNPLLYPHGQQAFFPLDRGNSFFNKSKYE